jgi:LysM repeat protein
MHKTLVKLAMGVGAAVVISGSALASDGEPSKQAPKPEPKVHVVAPGDNLSAIAESEKLESWRPLWNANPELTDPDLIYADQKLVVPEGTTTDRPLPEGVTALPERTYAPQGGQVYATTNKTASAAKPAANYAAGAPGLLERIRMRESGGNYAINTGNGFYGAYQFTLGTWQGVGGTGLPSQASPAEQDMRAQMLLDRRGCSPWPNTCY